MPSGRTPRPAWPQAPRSLALPFRPRSTCWQMREPGQGCGKLPSELRSYLHTSGVPDTGTLAPPACLVVERESLSLGDGGQGANPDFSGLETLYFFHEDLPVLYLGDAQGPCKPCDPRMHLGGLGDGTGRQKASQRGGGSQGPHQQTGAPWAVRNLWKNSRGGKGGSQGKRGLSHTCHYCRTNLGLTPRKGAEPTPAAQGLRRG